MRVCREQHPAVPVSVSVGVLATLTMDAAFLAASRLGGAAWTSDKVGLELIGRWAGGLACGRCRHLDIAAEPARRGEAAVGLGVHYLTGITLTWAYHVMLRRGRRGAGPLGAAAYGAATGLLPLLVLYPSWGLGPFALRSDEAPRLVRIMLLGHTVFGAAIGLWTAALSGRTAARYVAGRCLSRDRSGPRSGR